MVCTLLKCPITPLRIEIYQANTYARYMNLQGVPHTAIYDKNRKPKVPYYCEIIKTIPDLQAGQEVA